MTTETITAGLLVMAAATAALLLVNRVLIRRGRESTRLMHGLQEALSEAQNFKADVMTSLYSPAKVEERQALVPYFAVYREGVTDKVDIARYHYNPEDPDDREYKRIHAEEVAEKLSEKP